MLKTHGTLCLFLCMLMVTSVRTYQAKASMPLPEGRHFLGYLQSPAGSGTCNPCVENVIESINTLQNRGETLGFYWGDNYPAVAGSGTSNHWQGIQRLPLMGLAAPYLVVSSSHRYPINIPKPAYFAVVEMESRGAVTGRLRSNRLEFGKLTRDVPPNPLDRIVKAQMITPEFDHAGAMQAIGKYLLVSADERTSDSQNLSLLTLWDMSTPYAPQNVWRDPAWELPGRYAGSVGIVKLENSKFLLVRALQDAKQLEFYILQPDLEENPATYLDGSPWDTWDYRELKSDLHEADGTLDLNWADLYNVLGKAGYENVNIVTECGSGRLYLIASHGRRPSGFGGEDCVDAYRLEVPVERPKPDSPDGVIITKVAKRQLHPVGNAGARQGDLQAAAGIYVSPDNKLYFYATEHGVSGPGGSVTMIEFAPQVPRSNVTDIEDAWVELYDEKKFDGRSIVLDYKDRKLRDYNHLENIETFDNISSSVIYAIPEGYVLRLFSEGNQRGGYFDLVGTGQAEKIEDFAGVALSNGESADNRISSVKWHCTAVERDDAVSR